MNTEAAVDLTGDTSAAETIEDPEQIIGRRLRKSRGIRNTRSGNIKDTMEEEGSLEEIMSEG